jgi:hypothetical protein
MVRVEGTVIHIIHRARLRDRDFANGDPSSSRAADAGSGEQFR